MWKLFSGHVFSSRGLPVFFLRVSLKKSFAAQVLSFQFSRSEEGEKNRQEAKKKFSILEKASKNVFHFFIPRKKFFSRTFLPVTNAKKMKSLWSEKMSLNRIKKMASEGLFLLDSVKIKWHFSCVQQVQLYRQVTNGPTLFLSLFENVRKKFLRDWEVKREKKLPFPVPGIWIQSLFPFFVVCGRTGKQQPAEELF